MSKISAAILSIGLLFAGASAFAQDTMKKDAKAKEGMAKDEMKK